MTRVSLGDEASARRPRDARIERGRRFIASAARRIDSQRRAIPRACASPLRFRGSAAARCSTAKVRSEIGVPFGRLWSHRTACRHRYCRPPQVLEQTMELEHMPTLRRGPDAGCRSRPLFERTDDDMSGCIVRDRRCGSVSNSSCRMDPLKDRTSSPDRRRTTPSMRRSPWLSRTSQHL